MTVRRTHHSAQPGCLRKPVAIGLARGPGRLHSQPCVVARFVGEAVGERAPVSPVFGRVVSEV